MNYDQVQPQQVDTQLPSPEPESLHQIEEESQDEIVIDTIIVPQEAADLINNVDGALIFLRFNAGENITPPQADGKDGEQDLQTLQAALTNVQQGTSDQAIRFALDQGLAYIANQYKGISLDSMTVVQAVRMEKQIQAFNPQLNFDTASDQVILMNAKAYVQSCLTAWNVEEGRISMLGDHYAAQISLLTNNVIELRHTAGSGAGSSQDYGDFTISINTVRLTEFNQELQAVKYARMLKAAKPAGQDAPAVSTEAVPADIVEGPDDAADTAKTTTSDAAPASEPVQEGQQQTPEVSDKEKISAAHKKYINADSFDVLHEALDELSHLDAVYGANDERGIPEVSAEELFAQLQQLAGLVSEGKWYQVIAAVDPKIQTESSIHGRLARRLNSIIGTKYGEEKTILVELSHATSLQSIVDTLSRSVERKHSYFILPKQIPSNAASSESLYSFNVKAVRNKISARDFTGLEMETALLVLPNLQRLAYGQAGAAEQVAAGDGAPEPPKPQARAEAKEKMTTLGLDTAGASEKNPKPDKENEDAFSAGIEVQSSQGPVQIDLLADGVTQDGGGPLARFIIETYTRYFKANPNAGNDTDTYFAEATASVRKALSTDALALNDTYTTFVATLRTHKQVVTYHVGDSRAYLYQDGKLEKLTKDDTWIQEALDAGRINEAEAQIHPNRHVVKKYISSKGLFDLTRTPPRGELQSVSQDAVVFLATDGVHEMFTGYSGEQDTAVQQILASNDAAAEKVRKLIELAKQNGTKDDATVVLSQNKRQVRQQQPQIRPANVSADVVAGAAVGRKEQEDTNTIVLELGNVGGYKFSKGKLSFPGLPGVVFSRKQLENVTPVEEKVDFRNLYTITLEEELPILSGNWFRQVWESKGLPQPKRYKFISPVSNLRQLASLTGVQTLVPAMYRDR